MSSSSSIRNRFLRWLGYGAVVAIAVLLMGEGGCDDCTDDPLGTLLGEDHVYLVVRCVNGVPMMVPIQTLWVTDIILSEGAAAADYDCLPADIPVRRSRGGSTTSPCPRRQVRVNPPVGKGRAAGAPAPPLRRILDLPFNPVPANNDLLRSSACDAATAPDLLVVSQANNRLIRYGSCPVIRQATITLADIPVQAAVTPDNSTAIVTSFSGSLNFIDLTSNRVVATVSTGTATPTGIDITSDGKTAYVTSFSEAAPELLTVDLATRTITARTTIATFAQSVFLTPDGTQAWLTFPVGNLVQVYDLASMTLVTQIPATANFSIAFNSTGTRAYITSQGSSPGKVIEVDMSTYRVLRNFDVGVGPFDIEVGYGDRLLAVTNVLDSSFSAIRLADGKVQTAPLGGALRGLSAAR